MRVELPPGNSTEQEYLLKADDNTKRKENDHSSESFGNNLTNNYQLSEVREVQTYKPAKSCKTKSNRNLSETKDEERKKNSFKFRIKKWPNE